MEVESTAAGRSSRSTGCVAQQEGIADSATLERGRRHRRYAEFETAADARCAKRHAHAVRARRASIVDRSGGRRVVPAGDRAAAAIRSRPTSPSSRAATSSARSASCRTRAATSACGPWPTSWPTRARPWQRARSEIQLLGQIVNHYQAPDDPSAISRRSSSG